MIRNKKVIQKTLSKTLTTAIVISLISTNILPVYAETVNSRPILNMPSSEDKTSNNNSSNSLEGTESTTGTDLEEYVGVTNPIEGTASGSISIPGLNSGEIDVNVKVDPVTLNLSKTKNNETLYPLVINNIFTSNGTNLNIPQSLISQNILKEIGEADIVDWRNFDNNSNSSVTYSPLMSSEYKRALTWLSENNIIHPFPQITVKNENGGTTISTELISSPYQSYRNDNGVMISNPINKADFVMNLMKAVDGVQWSRPLSVKSLDYSEKQVEPVLDSSYRAQFLKSIGNLDLSSNNVNIDRSKYQTESIYMNPNIYELYFTAALNNGILDVTDFSDKNQFVYDYIGWQTFRLQANSEQALKDRGNNDTDSEYNYARRFPRWLVRNQLMRLDSSNPASSKINYIPGSKPFGESYNYGTSSNTNIYLGDSIVEQPSLIKDGEPNIITQYLTFSSAEKPYASRYKQLVDELPSLSRMTIPDNTPFDSNSMRELSMQYDIDAVKSYFNSNEMTVLDAFKLIYKSLKHYDDIQLTSMEADITTSKFGIRFIGLSDEDKEVVNYLIAKGIINPEHYDKYILNGILTQEDAYVLLYRLCNKSARFNTNFEITQKELEMVKQGYVQTTVEFQEVADTVKDISVKVNSSGQDKVTNGYFPVYVTSANSNKLEGFLTTSDDQKLNAEYTNIITDNKNQFVAFLVPNTYLNSNLRINVNTSSGIKAITGIKGSGIYTIPDIKGDVSGLSLTRYDLSYGKNNPSKIDDIRKHLLQTSSTYDSGANEPAIEEVINTSIGIQFTNGLKVYSYIDNRVNEAKPSEIADSSSDNYLVLLGDGSDRIESIKTSDQEVQFTKILHQEDKRTYYTLNSDVRSKDLVLKLSDGKEIQLTHNSLFYEVNTAINEIIPVNIATYYNYSSSLSDKEIEKEVGKALAKVIKQDASMKDIAVTYLLTTKYNYSKIEKKDIKEIKSLFNLQGLFNITNPMEVFKISNTASISKLYAPTVETDVTLGFNKDSLQFYKFQDINVFNNGTVNSEFIAELKKLVSDITVSDKGTSGDGTSQLHINFLTKQRSSENLLSILLNKITIAGDLKTETKVAFVSIMAGQKDNRKGVLIPESELGKYGLEVIQDTTGRKNMLKNTKTGVTAYLNQALNKALIGNEVHNYGDSALLYTTTDEYNYYNLSVISELMAIDSLSSSITSNKIIVPYKTSGFTGQLLPTAVGDSLVGVTQEQVDSNEYTLIGDNIVATGTRYIKNGRNMQVISADGGSYIDLTTATDASNGFMIARAPYGNARRLVIGYELDRNIKPESVSSTGNISSTLDSYINDIKKTPVRTLKSKESIQRAKDNLILNNTIAHAVMQTDKSYANKSITNEYLSKPIINVILHPSQTNTAAAYNELINYLVSYHNQSRTYNFLGDEMTLPISGDVKEWYTKQIRLNDSNSPVRVNIVPTFYKDGVEPTNINTAALISNDGMWMVASSGNTLIKAGYSDTNQNGLNQLGFRVAVVNGQVRITNPYLYAGLPYNTIPVEELNPGVSLKLPSGKGYTVIDPVSTIVYKGTTNMLYNDMAVSLVSDQFTKATKILGGLSNNDSELDIWNHYYAGLRDQAYVDAEGIDRSYISDPWKITLSKTNASNREIASDQVLTMLTQNDMFANFSQQTTQGSVSAETSNFNITGNAVIPFAGSRAGEGRTIKYYTVNENLISDTYQRISWDTNVQSTPKLDSIKNNTVLLGKPILRFKYGTMIANVSSKDSEGYYKAQQFNSGSRYVQKVFIESPVAEIRSILYNEAVEVKYLKDLPKGSIVTEGSNKFVKTDEATSTSSEYITFIASTPDAANDDAFRSSLTPLALKTARVLAGIVINGDTGLKVPLLNLSDLNSFVPPTKAELQAVLPYIDKSDQLYSTVYVNDYKSTDVQLRYGNMDGRTITEVFNPASGLKVYSRFDLNPYIKVIKIDDGNTYSMLGYDNKGTHATSKDLKNYAAMFRNAEEGSDPLTLWEDFTGLELADLYLKDRNLYDPMFEENLVAVQASSVAIRAESLGYRIKLMLYISIIAYTIILMAFLPLLHFKIIRETLRTRAGKLFLKIITLGRVDNPDEIDIKQYYPVLLMVLIITLMLYNSSFNLTFLNTLADITYKLVVILHTQIKILLESLYL